MFWGIDDDYFAISLKNGNTLSISNGNGGPYDIVVNGINDGQYHLISLSFNGTDYRLYTDGTLKSTFQRSPADDQIPGSLNVVIGYVHSNRCVDNSYFEGNVDDVRIYNRPISAAEVIQLYTQSSSTCQNCSFSDLSTPSEALDAASCLCNLGYVTPQYHGPSNTNGVMPLDPIYRADLAKLVYFAINQGDVPSATDTFPVPFFDLQKDAQDYYRYAKALSYLEYGDGVSPFSRNFANFYPYNYIERRYALKVLLEAYNIPPDETDAGVSLGINVGEDGYGYMHKAYDLGLITVGNATEFMLRQDIFIILQRLLSSCGSDCSASCMAPMPTAADYYVPGNITPYNTSRSFGMAEGYFRTAPTTSFQIPGINLPLEFSYMYNSYLLHLPDSVNVINPLGLGWTHTYQSYIVKQRGWQNQGITIDDHWMVIWPDGSRHNYRCSDNQPISYGVYDELSISHADTLEIKKQSQVRFTYARHILPSSQEIYLLVRIQDRNGNKIIIDYSQNIKPRINTVTGTAGRELQFNYESPVSDKIMSITDQAGGRTVYFQVDADDNLMSYTDPNGHQTQYGYTNQGDTTILPRDRLLHSIIRPEGNTITNIFENKCLMSTQIGTSAPTRVSVTPTYSTTGGISSVLTDGNGTRIGLAFGKHGLLNQKIIQHTELDYRRDSIDPALVTSMNYQGLESHYRYDTFGRVDTIKMPLGIQHCFSYTTLHDIETYHDPRGNATNYFYDGNGNIDRILDNMGFETDFTINNFGQVTEIENPEGIIQTMSYDQYGNLTQTESPLDIVNQIAYDNVGRIDSVINPQQQVTKYEYDNLGLVNQAIRRSSVDGDITTLYGYDKNNNLSKVTNALGGVTSLSYDNRDLLDSLSFGDDAKSYLYREDGLLSTYKKPDGHLFQYEYDTLGRMLQDGYASYVYDSLDNIVKVTKDDMDLNMAYDSINRLDTVLLDGQEVSYEYDKNGNLKKLIYPGGFQVTYNYDANNRLVDLTFDSKQIIYDYLDDGRLKKVMLPNGVEKHYRYDQAGRMNFMADVKDNSDTICRYNFTLDSLGNHTREDRLEPLGEPSLEELNVFYSYNNENEIEFANDLTFSFDANGDQIGQGDSVAIFDYKDMLLSFR